MRRRTTPATAAVLASGILLGALTGCSYDDKATAQLTEVEAAKIAEGAYVFGFPLVLMDVTNEFRRRSPSRRVQSSDQPVRSTGGRFPMPRTPT